MRWIIGRIRRWLAAVRVNHESAKIRELLTRAEAGKKKADRRLRQVSRSLQEIGERMSALEDELRQAKRSYRDYDDALEAVRVKLQIVEEVMVPGLVQANKVFEERWKAETELHVRRQVAAMPAQIEE